MRIIIKSKINKVSDKKAVVIGINSSKTHDGESDTILTKISRYLYQYNIGENTMINLFETIPTEQEGIDVEQACYLEKNELLFEAADLIVVAWGTEDKYIDENDKAFQYFMQWKEKVYCIQDKRGNMPRHPSRIAYTDKLVRFYVYDNKKYPVITLCGSTRFKDDFIEAQKKLTLQGYIVISVGLFGHSGKEVWENMDEGNLTKVKEMLKEIKKLLDLEKINEKEFEKKS